MKRDQSTTILSILIFTIAIMMSGNVFAADTTPRRVSQPEFDAAMTNQATINTALEKDIADLKALIGKYHPKKIGDHFGGGIIFYVDTTGQHGLIASSSDQGSNIQWYNGVFKVVGATGDGVGAGATNTAIIVAAQMVDNPMGKFAAKVTADSSVQEDGLTACTGSVDEVCYGDWYLPSKHELSLLYPQRAAVGGFAAAWYWSSTEIDANLAWLQDFDGGGLQSMQTKDSTTRVRAIRAF